MAYFAVLTPFAFPLCESTWYLILWYLLHRGSKKAEQLLQGDVKHCRPLIGQRASSLSLHHQCAAPDPIQHKPTTAIFKPPGWCGGRSFVLLSVHGEWRPGHSTMCRPSIPWANDGGPGLGVAMTTSYIEAVPSWVLSCSGKRPPEKYRNQIQ